MYIILFMFIYIIIYWLYILYYIYTNIYIKSYMYMILYILYYIYEATWCNLMQPLFWQRDDPCSTSLKYLPCSAQSLRSVPKAFRNHQLVYLVRNLLSTCLLQTFGELCMMGSGNFNCTSFSTEWHRTSLSGASKAFTMSRTLEDLGSGSRWIRFSCVFPDVSTPFRLGLCCLPFLFLKHILLKMPKNA